VIPPSAEELATWKKLPFDEEHYRISEVGSKQLVGEKGYSVLERTGQGPRSMYTAFRAALRCRRQDRDPGQGHGQGLMRLVPGMTRPRPSPSTRASLRNCTRGCRC